VALNKKDTLIIFLKIKKSVMHINHPVQMVNLAL